MTPKEKAIDLVEIYWTEVRDYKLTDPSMSKEQAKQCALVAVDEIIKAIVFDWMEVQNLDRQYAYWEQVEQELNKSK